MWRHHPWFIVLISSFWVQGCAGSPSTLSPDMQAAIQSLAQRLCDPCSTHPQHETQPLTKNGYVQPTRSPETSLPAASWSAVDTDMGHEP